MDTNDGLKTEEVFNLEKLKSIDFSKKYKKVFVSWTLIFLVVLFFVLIIFFSPPLNFPEDKIIHIEDGLNLGEISSHLGKENIIKYPSLFKVLAFLSGNQTSLFSGDYFFDKKINLIFVLRRLSKGQYNISPVEITFPEGFTVEEIADNLVSNFEDFDKGKFLELAKNKEGFLFPDTYKFLPNVGPRKVIFDMEANFDKKIGNLRPEILRSNRTTKEIIIMASLLEEEARTRETREIISGILWKRIEIGMPLQVDAVFPYIIGKNTFELTLEDLEFDSPYNTYKYAGLPPGPISNPGLNSIESALRPVESDYLFYLSDKSGKMHYAEDFEGHKRNKALYLR